MDSRARTRLRKDSVLRGHTRIAPAASHSSRGFDRDSGLVYQETEIAFGKGPIHDWVRGLRTPKIIKNPEPNEKGARSLQMMARSKCASEARNFDRELLEHVPWSTAEALWDEVESRHLESFYSWCTFAAVYRDNDEFGSPKHRYYLEVRNTSLALNDYYRGLTSTNQDWHVALRISPKQHTVSDLVALSQVTNLGVLDLSDGQLLLDTRASVFEDRILRSWAELAGRGTAFQHLRVLMLGWQDNASATMFRYFSAFPSLAYVIVTDCKTLHQKNRAEWEAIATSCGWTALHAKKSVKTLRPLMEDESFYKGAISSCYYLKSRDAEHIDGDRPLVECCLGTPRVWTHIIDEFPGTRTVWFEREKSDDSLRPASIQQVKRFRPQSHGPNSTPSPPSKKLQGFQNRKLKDRPRSAGGLLAELGC